MVYQLICHQFWACSDPYFTGSKGQSTMVCHRVDSGKYDNFRQGFESVINTCSQNSSKITHVSSYICIFFCPKMKLFEGYYPNLYVKVSH